MKKHKSYYRRIDRLKYLAEGIGIVIAFAWIFYHSMWPVIIMSPIAFLFVKKKIRESAVKKKRQFNTQFKDAIIAISSALSSGYSLENSVVECIREMELLYGKESDIYGEMCNISSQVRLNIPIEKLFLELAENKEIDDVSVFAQIIVTAKRTGGNMVDIIKNTSNTISEKMETRKEIEVMMSAKKMEQKIMNIVPLFMIAYISMTSQEFLNIMYETIAGRIIMSACLAVYIFSYYLSERIVNIEV